MPPRDPNLPEGTDDIIGTDDMTGTDDMGFTSGSGTAGGAGSLGGSNYGGSGSGSDPFGGTSTGSGALGGSGIGGTQSGSLTGGGSTGSLGGASSTGTSGMDVQSLKSQASDKVRDVATQGKDKATEALDSVSRLVGETADTVDERLGPQYGNYVRKAADALDGLNDSIRGKQVDELFDDARNLVRKSPAVAIGAAAAIGFLLVRLVKSGMPQTVDQDDYYAGGDQARLTGQAPRVDNSYDPIA